MKKIFLIFLSIFLFNMSFSQEKPLVVGMELAYPPFETTDTQGNPTGFSVDLAKDLGKYLGRPVVIENMAYGGLIPSLMTKKIDIILSSMSITKEREKAISFSDPYANSFLTILASSKSKVKHPMDLNAPGMQIAVKNGTTGHLVATEYFPKAEILVFQKETAAVLEVSQHKVDAFIYDPMSIYKNWKNYKDTTTPILEKFQTSNEYWGIGYRKQDKKLGKEINSFLKEYKKNGGFEKLTDKYLKEEKEQFKAQGIPFFIN